MVSQVDPFEKLQNKIAQQDLELARWDAVLRNLSAQLGVKVETPERLHEIMNIILQTQVLQ